MSRRVRPLKRQWSCPFPAEADLEQINYQQVPVRVVVTSSGRARSTKATKDPGYGFARAAQRCAKRHRYAPELNRLGKPISGTFVVMVKFKR